MKIILLADVYKHGVKGEVVEVADGFARNYLIPKGLATKATNSELRRYQKVMELSEARRLEYEGMLNELGHKIDGTELIFFRRAANTGKLFGSVTTADIADELDRVTGVDINRRRVSQQPLRETGLHEVPVRLGTDVSPLLNIRILAEDQRIEYERQREAVAEGLLDELQYNNKGTLTPVDLNKLRSKQEKAEAETEAAAELAEAQTAVAAVEDMEVSAVDEDMEVSAVDEYDDYDDYDDFEAPPAVDAANDYFEDEVDEQ